MRVSTEYDDYLTRFIELISWDSHNFELLAEQKGIGAEYYFCSYDEEDFDYMPNKVSLIFWGDFWGDLWGDREEDTILYVEPNMFYQYIEKAYQEYIEKHPNKKEIMKEALEKIKRDLCITE